MGATVSVNGQHLGVVKDQFLRYSFPLTVESGTLTLTFSPDIDCEGRFMACTGGWDWAPYTDTTDQHGAYVMTRGIWKSVYIVSSESSILEYSAPFVSFVGKPSSGIFDVQIKVVCLFVCLIG